jgi:ATP-dependent Clp protease adapter protein ClpS
MSELLKDKVKDSGTTLGPPHNVLLFNDSVHSFEEVTIMIMATIKCDANRAAELANEAHSKGQAIVFSGTLETCELKEMILSGPPAALTTSIESA